MLPSDAIGIMGKRDRRGPNQGQLGPLLKTKFRRPQNEFIFCSAKRMKAMKLILFSRKWKSSLKVPKAVTMNGEKPHDGSNMKR